MDFLEGFYDGLEKESRDGRGKGGDADDPAFKKDYPCLHAFLTVTTVKKVPREPGTVFLFVQAGAFKACLTDKRSGMTLWQAQDTFGALLQALEDDLAGGDRSLWRKKQPWKGKTK